MGKPSTETPERGYDAGDEGQVGERRARVKIKENAITEGLRYIMATAQGRAWMCHLLSEKLFTRVGTRRPAAIFTGNSTTFYNAAHKELGDIIATELATLAPAEFRLMEQEAHRG